MTADLWWLVDDRPGRPYVVDLGPGPDPSAVIPRLDGEHGVGCLWGSWFDGGVALLSDPLHVAEPERVTDGFALLDSHPVLADAGQLPGILGGWLAFLGYDAGCSWLGFYDHLVTWYGGRWRFETLGLPGRDEATAAALSAWRRRLDLSQPPAVPLPGWSVGDFSTRPPAVSTRDHYLAAVEAAIGRIHRGDFYQVNLCTRLFADLGGSSSAMFADMAAALRPRYGILAGESRRMVGFSPELFLRVRGDVVTTSPIKGTAPRSVSETDSAALRSSAKDAAENIMIVDLMRNDLSRVSRPGTVAVSDLLTLQPHPGVWHLVSSVRAVLQAGVGLAELLEATFPPGSVTGAPKSSAVRAIADLEQQGRGAYTGAAGFVSPYAGADLAVVIRSFEVTDAEVSLGVGSGITADSVPVREWQECLDKAAPLVAAARSGLVPDLAAVVAGRPLPDLRRGGVFESILVVDGIPLRTGDHLARIDRSCRELYGRGPDETVARQVRDLADAAERGREVVRVAVVPDGDDLVTTVARSPLPPRLRTCALVGHHRPRLSWRHKWQDRTALQAAELAVGTSRLDAATGPALPYFEVDDPARDTPCAAETSRGNLFTLTGAGHWATPPLDDNVLPGVTRRAVLDVFDAMTVPSDVAPVGVSLLRNTAGAFWTSSLSGAVVVTAVDGVAIPTAAATKVADLLNERLGVCR